MAIVEMRFAALPSHVRTARLVGVSVARRAGLDPELLDEVRQAVGEACARAVALHERCAPGEPVLMRLIDGGDSFHIELIDVGPSVDGGEAVGDVQALLDVNAMNGGDQLPTGFRLAVITGLVDDLTVTAESPVGTRVRMTWALPGPGPVPGVAASP